MYEAITHRRRVLYFLVPALLAASVLIAVLAGSARAAVTINVNSTADGTGGCAASGGQCTLRGAIQKANNSPGADVINLPAGTYELGIEPLNENGIANGDLDITGDVTINGANRTTTFIDGGVPKAGSPPEARGLDRLFEVHPSAGDVRINRVTLQDGYSAEFGGALLNSGDATVAFSSSRFLNNFGGKTGGAVDNHANGFVRVSGSTFSRNAATEGGSAINNNRGGTLEVTTSTINGNTGNAVGNGGAAILNNAELDTSGAIEVADSTITGNTGNQPGSAINNDGPGTVDVTNTSITNNTSVADGGGIHNDVGEVTVTGSTFSGNGAASGGAINSGGTLTVRSSTFGAEQVEGNTASAEGGAINSSGTLSVLENTKFHSNTAQGEGGAIHNADKGSVEIADATFTENAGLSGGGFANNGDGQTTVSRTSFLRNHTAPTGDGGGLHTNSDGVFTMNDTTFTGNTALNGGGFSNDGDGTVNIARMTATGNTADGEGGGVAVHSGAVTISNSNVLTNTATVGGGGIAYQGDAAVSVGRSAAIRSTTVSGNTTQGTGGGIDSRGDGTFAVVTSTVSSNTAGHTGGGINHDGDAEISMLRSTISGNKAEAPAPEPGGEVGSGGGFFTDGDGAALLENTTISGNTAKGFGGGILVSSRATLSNVTLYKNSASSGGGINNGGGDLVGDGFVFAKNTIVAGSTSGGNCAGTVTSYGGNIDGLDTCHFREPSDQPATDPLLSPLANNGGLTFTHALRRGSPAQDKADCTMDGPPTPENPVCPDADQHGIAKPHGAGHDVGAFETERRPLPPINVKCAGRIERAVLASSDAWITQGSPANNFGTDPILKVKSQNTSNSRALVKFDLPSAPPGCELVGATLRLHSSSGTDGRSLRALRLGAPWGETEVTWGNQPATATGTGAAVSRSGLGYREWDVLAQTQKMYSGANNGFLIRDAAENGVGIEQSFHSREKGANDSPPELVLVFADLDAPPTCQTTPQTLAADADSWVQQNDPAKNLGLDSTLKIKSHSGANSRVLVKFPLPALPAGCTGVKSATLQMHSGGGPEDQTLQALRATGAWTETAVTWGNQPRVTGAAATATSRPEGLIEWNVVEQVRGMYSVANRGFVIRNAAENGTGAEQSLNSRERPLENPPELVVTYQ